MSPGKMCYDFYKSVCDNAIEKSGGVGVACLPATRGGSQPSADAQTLAFLLPVWLSLG